MTTTITVFVRPVNDTPEDHISLVCNGISYFPVTVVKVNDLRKFTFEVEAEPDTQTLCFGVSVSESIRTTERMG